MLVRVGTGESAALAQLRAGGRRGTREVLYRKILLRHKCFETLGYKVRFQKF